MVVALETAAAAAAAAAAVAGADRKVAVKGQAAIIKKQHWKWRLRWHREQGRGKGDSVLFKNSNKFSRTADLVLFLVINIKSMSHKVYIWKDSNVIWCPSGVRLSVRLSVRV
jgi:hypothetical protein